MAATAQQILTTRFIRRTGLQSHERNMNFTMFDNEIMTAVSSPEADAVTPLMSKIYLRLKGAPRQFFERENVLRFTGEERDGKWIGAWEQLRQHLHVSSETANKALKWMHSEGIIGYSAFKNGVGIRIFLNRAASSIGVRTSSGESGEPKVLRFPQTSADETTTSADETTASVSEAPFKDNTKKDLDKDYNSDAPKNGADESTSCKMQSVPISGTPPQTAPSNRSGEVEASTSTSKAVSMNEIIEHLRREIEPCMRNAATQAAAQATAREAERTRAWFETKALPKAVRVAQSETYNLLKKLGTFDARQERARAALQVKYAADEDNRSETPPARPLKPKEIAELAETCIALLEMQDKAIDVTLSEMIAEGNGWLMPEDAPKVREAAHALLDARAVTCGAVL